MPGDGRAGNTGLGYNDPLDVEHHEMNFAIRLSGGEDGAKSPDPALLVRGAIPFRHQTPP